MSCATSFQNFKLVLLGNTSAKRYLSVFIFGKSGGGLKRQALMMTVFNTWHTNAHFTAQSRPQTRGRAQVGRMGVGKAKGASATAQRWPLPTSPTSISSLDRLVPQHVAIYPHMYFLASFKHLFVTPKT